MSPVKIQVTESQLDQVGAALAFGCGEGGVWYLNGTLGMGKTALSRSIIQQMGWSASVKSPTYTLLEEYSTEQTSVLHFDLYRLSDAEELEFLGIRDLDPVRQLWLIEWPEKGHGFLPAPDMDIRITATPDATARFIEFLPQSAHGERQLIKAAPLLEAIA